MHHGMEGGNEDLREEERLAGKRTDRRRIGKEERAKREDQGSNTKTHAHRLTSH